MPEQGRALRLFHDDARLRPYRRPVQRRELAGCVGVSLGEDEDVEIDPTFPGPASDFACTAPAPAGMARSTAVRASQQNNVNFFTAPPPSPCVGGDLDRGWMSSAPPARNLRLPGTGSAPRTRSRPLHVSHGEGLTARAAANQRRADHTTSFAEFQAKHARRRQIHRRRALREGAGAPRNARGAPVFDWF